MKFCTRSSMAARSKAWDYGRSFHGIAFSNPTVSERRLSLENVVTCQVEVSALGWSLVQRSHVKCVLS